jgi:hypothetical protein
MADKLHVILNKMLFPWMILFFLMNTGCQQVQTASGGEKAKDLNIRKIVLIGFKPALYHGDVLNNTPGSVSGYTSSTDPALLEKAERMTSMLYEMMREEKGYELIGPDRSRETLSTVYASEPKISAVEIPGRIAREFKADVVLTGYLFRWRDRVGADYAASQPASVAFDLCLVNPEDGSILWHGRFDKTQRSLSENLLDVRTFLKGKGKWMTADALAGLGMKDLVRDLLLYMDKEKGIGN